jgi:ERCC4-type nuclease
MIIIDSRERQLIPLFPNSIKIQTLPVGDFWFEDASSNLKLIIERKTIKDLEASVLDGRYREQKGRLLALCEEKGAQPLYLLEGAYMATSGRISAPALMKIVARLQFKYAIPVMHANSLSESAILVQALHDYFLEDSANFTRDMTPLRPTEGIHVVKKVNAADPKQFLIACLMQCPGVSSKIAEVIATTYPSFQSLIEADEKGIADIQLLTGRRIGPVIAKRLKGFFQNY